MSEEDFFGNSNSAYLPSEVIHRFGNYNITGDLQVVGVYQTAKVIISLYYNHTKNQFFLLKEYQSGKFHIDIFLSFEYIEPGLLFDKQASFKQLLNGQFFDYPENSKMKVAFSTSYEEKLLSFDYSKNVYVVQQKNLDKVITLYFQKVKN
jgi:hypothetical protein